MRRVDEQLNQVTDEELAAWSVVRFDALKNQEGILRKDNIGLVNPWPKGPRLAEVRPEDFDHSSLGRDAILYLFKQAMDREEPTVRYAFAAAGALHDHLHLVSHFMGATLQEYILRAALKGDGGNMGMGAIWIREEKRHGPIMEVVYNASRDPSQPELKQQGIDSKDLVPGEYSARSTMANRSLAELGAGTAYLVLKANAKKNGPTDDALDGIFRDEIYHYAMMSAGNHAVFGQRSRFRRLSAIIRHSFDYPGADANDAYKFSSGLKPSMVFISRE